MKIKLVFLQLLLLLVASSCNKKEDVKETPPPPPNGRNLFGFGIKRGLIQSSDGIADGYVMYAVPNSPFVNLINRKGEVVHQWKGNYGVMNAYLQDDGALVQAAEDPDYPVFGEGGPYGRIQKITWDGKMLWDFEYANEDHIVHHDFSVMPNGNILAIAYEVMPYDVAIANGRKPELTVADGPWLEKIIEIEPQGAHGGRIVWEWHLWNHLIQNNDAAKANYGNPKDHPELMDFNLGDHMEPAITQDSLDILRKMDRVERNTTIGNQGSGIFHFNAIKYNADLDQIVVSSPAMNEIYIIDHSTTSKEAASHKGGKSGKGGDFLYRWGNPQNYQHGDSTNRKLFGQHDVRWIEKGKPGAGNLTVFNNYPPSEMKFENMGNASKTNYSAIYEITTPVDNAGKYIVEKDKPFGPEKPTWIYIAPDTLSFFSSFISGAHRMENGNTFINEGARGRFFEVTPDGKTVWEYANPYHGEIRKPNGDPVSPMFMPYSTFRSTFISASHPALVGKELKPIDPQPQPFILPPPPEKGKM